MYVYLLLNTLRAKQYLRRRRSSAQLRPAVKEKSTPLSLSLSFHRVYKQKISKPKSNFVLFYSYLSHSSLSRLLKSGSHGGSRPRLSSRAAVAPAPAPPPSGGGRGPGLFPRGGSTLRPRPPRSAACGHPLRDRQRLLFTRQRLPQWPLGGSGRDVRCPPDHDSGPLAGFSYDDGALAPPGCDIFGSTSAAPLSRRIRPPHRLSLPPTMALTASRPLPLVVRWPCDSHHVDAPPPAVCAAPAWTSWRRHSRVEGPGSSGDGVLSPTCGGAGEPLQSGSDRVAPPVTDGSRWSVVSRIYSNPIRFDAQQIDSLLHRWMHPHLVGHPLKSHLPCIQKLQ